MAPDFTKDGINYLHFDNGAISPLVAGASKFATTQSRAGVNDEVAKTLELQRKLNNALTIASGQLRAGFLSTPSEC